MFQLGSTYELVSSAAGRIGSLNKMFVQLTRLKDTVFNFTLRDRKILYLIIAPKSGACWEGKFPRDIKDFTVDFIFSVKI